MKNTRGMTLVEVLAAFTVLLVAASVFVTCLASANRQALRAEETRRQVYEIVQENAGTSYQNGAARGDTVTYTFHYEGLPPIRVTVNGGNHNGVPVFLPEN